MDFYTSETIVGWYLNNVQRIVTRVNAFTGIAYKDDPAIFAWDLINEPHAPGDETGKLLTVSKLLSGVPAITIMSPLSTL